MPFELSHAELIIMTSLNAQQIVICTDRSGSSAHSSRQFFRLLLRGVHETDQTAHHEVGEDMTP
jgi:hypothetical protein